MNELIWFSVIILSFMGVLVFFKFFGKTGLYVWSAMAVVIANIQAVKQVNLFGLETVLGTIVFSTTFVAINILMEKYGKKEAQKAIIISLVTIITVILLMALCVMFTPSTEDIADESLKLIFAANIRVSIGSVIAYFVSQICNISIYQRLKEKYNKPWISSNVSTIVAQLVDTIIFLLIAFIGSFSFDVLIQFLIARLVFKVIVTIASTPIIYAAKRMKVEQE